MDRIAGKIERDLDAIEEQGARQRHGYELRGTFNKMRRAPTYGCAASSAGLRFVRCSPAGAKELRRSLAGVQGYRPASNAQRLDGLDRDIVELREHNRLLEELLRFKLEEESNKHLRALSVITDTAAPALVAASSKCRRSRAARLADTNNGFLGRNPGVLVGARRWSPT